jgi:glycosyltransferase involved in cell wall biosynthesis
MAAGLPVVVTDYPGAEEAVGDAGLVVPRSDVPSLAGVLHRLADHSSERASLGERARARATQVFSLSTMIDRTRRIYDELLEAR